MSSGPELEPSISPPPSPSGPSSLELREQQAKEARREQLRRYQEWESSVVTEGKPARGPGGKRVSFEAKDLLWDAVRNHDIKQMYDILSNGDACPNTSSEATGVSLLHVCCLDNYLPGVQLLLEQGAITDLQDNDLWTPLHIASACGHKEIINLLLEHDADCTLLDVDGNFACDISHDPDVRDLLLKHMSLKGINEADMRLIRSSMAKAMLAAVKECIVRRIDLNLLNDNGVAPLHVAAANGYKEAAMLLIDLGGAHVNLVDDLGYTPLHIAAKYNQEKMVALLLSRGANHTLLSAMMELPIDMADSDEIIGMLEMMGEVQVKGHIRPTGLPIPEPLTPSKVHTVNIDLEQFESPQTQSKSIDLDTPISKLEALYEGETLTERDNFDEGVDTSTQRPALRRLRGSLFKKRASGSLFLPDPSTTDNLATLSDLTEDIVLKFLGERYSKDQIYTYIGEILVAINPFKALPIYNYQASETYSKKIPDTSLPPHVFAISNQIYRSMMAEGRLQTCLVSGESGAGKTETSKYLVQQLLFLSDSVERELNLKIEQVNPILEAFGNAKTVMNNNSSRFGKFLELSFTDDGQVLGATFREYLLEKSRVVNHGKGERNFHIFYQLFAGLSAEEKAELKLDDPEMHRCLAGMRESLEGVITPQLGDDFKEVRDSLGAIGFSEQEEKNMLQTLAAIVHIIDVTFDPKDEGVQLSNPSLTSVISDLLQINPQELALCLVQEAMVTRGEQILRHRSLLQANDCRDALAKALYGRMFGWIVNGINHHLQPENLDPGHAKKIGILDIFGFENFEKNSFEQMCINVANEQLQHFFNEHIFQWEQEDCSKEGVVVDTVAYESNWPVVELFLSKNVGVFALVDEESRFPQATDKSLATKLHKACADRAVYQAPPGKGTKFMVDHYAGKVKYDVLGFLDKNRDTLPPSVLQLLRTSGSLLVREIFEAKLTHTGSITPSKRQGMSRKAESPFSRFNRKTSRRLTRVSRKNAHRTPLRKPGDTGRRAPPTVANHFKSSLSELMDKLNSSSPHFIRCIKPNSVKKPNSYDPDYVAKQLKYVGVMETTRIRQSGYAVRLTYKEFLIRYKVLTEFYTYQSNADALDDEVAVGVVLNKVGVANWVGGPSKVFLKFNHPVQLEAHSQNILLHIISIQRWFRELKEWKAQQEELRIKREQAKLAREKAQTSAGEQTMAHHVKNGHGLQGTKRNSNHNNSGGLSRPQGYASPAQYSDHDYVNSEIIEEDIYDSVVDPQLKSIKSSPLDNGIIPMSVPQSTDLDHIYDTAVSVPPSQHTDYYNLEEDDDAVDEIYDDLAGVQTKSPPEAFVQSVISTEIKEDIYDDTYVTEFRSLHGQSTSSQDPDPEEMYSDAASVFEHPPPPQTKSVSLSLPPIDSIPEDDMYSDAASVFHSPPPANTTPYVKFMKPTYEEEEAVYNDASSVFDAPPLPIKPTKPQSRSPIVSAISEDGSSDVYTYLSELELKQALDPDEPPSPQQSTGPPPPPVPSRGPKLGTTKKATSVPVTLREEAPPRAPRRFSEQIPPPRPYREPPSPSPPPRPYREPPVSSSPKPERVIARQRSRAVRNRYRSVSEPLDPLISAHISQSRSPMGSIDELSIQSDDSRLSSSSSVGDVFTPPSNVRLGKRASEPVVRRHPLPSIPSIVAQDGPYEEDYTEIDETEELSFYESPLAPAQEYLAPVKQRAHRPLQASKSTGAVSQQRHSEMFHTSIDTRPKAPLPLVPSAAADNRPPKPPRTRSISAGAPAVPARLHSKQRDPSVVQRKVPLPDVPKGQPPPRPSRSGIVPRSPPMSSRNIPLPDTPSTPPPPRPSRRSAPVTAPTVPQPPPTPPQAPPSGPPSSPPAPPPIGGPMSTSHSNSHPTASESPSSLLSGLQSVQLKKANDRPARPPPTCKPESSGPSTGNLMAEMQSFKLRKTSAENKSPPSPRRHIENGSHLKLKPTHPPPVVTRPPVPATRPKKAPPRLPAQKPNGHMTSHDPTSSVPEWKKSVLDRRRREQEESMKAEQAAEERWAGVPAWRRKLIEERAAHRETQ